MTSMRGGRMSRGIYVRCGGHACSMNGEVVQRNEGGACARRGPGCRRRENMGGGVIIQA